MEKVEYGRMFAVEDNHFWYKGMRKITETLLNKFLKKKTGNVILDAGCGTGANMVFFGKFGIIKGFDISEKAILLCEKRGLKHAIRGSIDAIPYESATFDTVICFDVLGQKQVADTEKAIKEFYRTLKPGGMLVLRTAAYQWLFGYHDKAVHTKHRFHKKEVETLLRKHGFTILQTTYANTLLFPLLLFLRFVKRFSKTKYDSDVNNVHPFLNSVLYIPFFIESFFIRYFNLPFGMSVISVARK